MKLKKSSETLETFGFSGGWPWAVALLASGVAASAQQSSGMGVPTVSTNSPAVVPAQPVAQQNWNFHAQNTDIIQGYPGFHSKYPDGPNSLPSGGEGRETISVDLLAGVRLWHGAEAHVDGLMWQGFGVGNTVGLEGFSSG